MNRRSIKRFSDSILRPIIKRYENSDIILDNDYESGEINPLWQRFERAAINQFEDGDATLSRYAIWANTVRDNIIECINKIECDPVEARKHLIRAANSLSAFSQLQTYFDPFNNK